MVKRGKNYVQQEGELLDKLTSDCDDALLQNSSVYTDPYHGNNFLKHLYEMYLSQTLTDVILVVENMEIHAHKMVLATNSPYFEGMFTTSLMESINERVLMREVRYEVLKGIVDYCYTGSLLVNGDNSLELISIANMFEFEGIKEHCSTYLKQNLDASNCLNIVTFADLHTCQSLKETAEQFCRINFLEVVKSQDFLEIEPDQLKCFLANDAISVTSEKDVFEAIVAWVEKDEENRKCHFTELLQTVRLVHLPAKVLVDSIENHRFTQDCSKSLRLINEVKTYQLLPSHRDSLQVNNTIPRMNQLDQHIYLVGGETRSQVFESVECYSFAESCWKAKADLCSPRDGLGIACYDGNIFVAGGYDGNTALASCECYIPEKNCWTQITSMHNQRHAFSMTELNGWLYVGGGSNFASIEYNTAERFDPIRNEWFQIESMSNKREGLTMISDDNVVYAIGGENGFSILNTVEKYDPRVGTWYNCAPMGYRRRYFGAAVLNSRIFCVGGSDYEDDLNTVESFDARANRWIPIPSMSRRRESVAVCVAKDKLFALGGACRNKETDTTEVFDPVMNKWEPFCSLRRAKEGMGVVVLR